MYTSIQLQMPTFYQAKNKVVPTQRTVHQQYEVFTVSRQPGFQLRVYLRQKCYSGRIICGLLFTARPQVLHVVSPSELRRHCVVAWVDYTFTFLPDTDW